MKKSGLSLEKLSSDKIFYIKKTGNYIKGKFIQLWFLNSGNGWQVLANQKTFKTAVLRNLAKRRLRELLRKNKIKDGVSGLISFRNFQGLSEEFSAIDNDYKNLIKNI